MTIIKEIQLSKGKTINMGNYESLRLEMSITISDIEDITNLENEIEKQFDIISKKLDNEEKKEITNDSEYNFD